MKAKGRVLVIGLGVTGKAAAAFLQKKGYEVVGADRSLQTGQSVFQVVTDQQVFEAFDFDLVVVSPGVPPENLLYQRALKEGVEIISEIELAFRHLKKRAVGITGSNGKSTTVSMIAHVLNHAGLKARAVGNIGVPLIDCVEGEEDEILIIELSSFQLEKIQTAALEMAAILNITPNHLDRHGTMEIYTSLKWKIKDLVKEGGLFLSPEFNSNFSLAESLPSVILSERKSLPFTYRICRELGISDALFLEALASFKALPHRLQLIDRVKGVWCINDSKSTSVASTLHAIEMLGGKRELGQIILIAGGFDKGASYEPWKESFRGKVKAVIVMGPAREKIADTLQEAFSIYPVETLEEAVSLGIELGEEGDTLLLSPGCSSYDAFRDYQERGERFEKGVKNESKRYDLSGSAH